jgi:signal transduction histidine kinase
MVGDIDVFLRCPGLPCLNDSQAMWSIEIQESILKKTCLAVGYTAVLTGIYLIELHSYLLFHTMVELFSVCVAFAIFMIVWNCRHFIQNNYMLFLGMAYFFVGGLDLMHVLAFPGMGIFPGDDPNLATQLWVAARYFESLSLVLAILFLRRRIPSIAVLLGCGVISCLLILSIFTWAVFPVCFREPMGLTRFKEISEFLIIAMLFVSLGLLVKNRSWFDPLVLKWVVWSIVLTVASEFMFTLYAAPYDRKNMAGHFFKLISFYLMYKSLIETGLRQPHTLLYRRLKQHELDLQQAHDVLEDKVQQRTHELSQTVARLTEQVTARLKAEEMIQAKQRQLQALTVQLLTVEDQERRRIASELHDSVGQILAFLKIELGELQRSVLPEELIDTFARVREQVDQAIQQTRTLTFEISPPELYALGLESALEELAQRFGEARQLACHVYDSEEPKALSDHVKNLLYRLVRELLINVAKHAKAHTVHIQLARVENNIQIAVVDDGVGFDVARLDNRLPDTQAGFGLFSIKERLGYVGGTMDIQSGPGRGTRVTIAAPLDHSETHE